MTNDTIETETAHNDGPVDPSAAEVDAPRGEGPTLEVAPEEVAAPLHTTRALVVMDEIDRRIVQDLSDLVGSEAAEALWASLDQGGSAAGGRRWVWYAFMLARLSYGVGDAFDRVAYNKAIALLAIVAAGGGK